MQNSLCPVTYHCLHNYLLSGLYKGSCGRKLCVLSRHAVGAKVEIRRLSYFFFFFKLLTYAKIDLIPQKTKHVGTLWKLLIVAETLCGIFLHSVWNVTGLRHLLWHSRASLNDGDSFREMRRYAISSLCERHRVYLHKPRQYSIAYYTPTLYGIAYCS